MLQRQAQTSEELELLKANDKNLPYVILATYQARLATLRATAPTNHHNLDLLHEPTQRSLEAWWVDAIALNSEMQAWGELICQGSLAYSELLNETGTWPKTFHVYPEILTAGFWNSYRCARILLLSDLLDYDTRIGPTFVFPEPNTFQASMLQMINDICASVPFLLGDFDPQGSLQKGAGRMSLGGYFLVFALHVVGYVRIVKDDQLAWIKGRLKRVGYTMGIKQAHLLCERL